VNRLETPAIRAIVVNYRDVSERRTMEERLRRSENRHRAILDGALDAVVGMDLAGRVTYWNPRAEALFGWPRGETVGRPLRDLIIPERYRDAHSRGLERLVQSGQTKLVGRRIEIEAVRRDGTEFPVELTIAALATEEALEFNAFVADISERRRLEEQLRQSQKMEAVGLLAGGVAHDFNNLLNVILGYGDMLLRDVEADDPRRRRLEQICRAAERAAALTRQLLAFSRKQVLQPSVVDLNDVVSDVESMLRRLIGADVELVSVRGADPARVKVDRGQIEQVILNLAVNARDAMPAGGSLVLETSREVLDADFVQSHPGAVPGRYIALAVTDSGHGMDAETQARVFEPFFTTKEHGKGTGLGLSTVYGIVKQSGGYISVYSEPGRGSTFRVYLPETEESPTPAETQDRSRVAASPVTETVLVAEDEPALRDLIREVLEAEGYRVLACQNGTEALQLAAGHAGDIQLLLTDVVMPDMTGPELARRLARTRPAFKTLFISGYAQAAATQQGVLPPGVPFLPKPFGPDLLARRVREILEEQGGPA
jgi:PAS domain S-box-containing protein